MIKAQSDKDQLLLMGLLQADSKSVEQIYDLVLPTVIHWVISNNGSEEDARDIFQEALVALFRKVEVGQLVLTCSLKSFIRIMCRNIWFSRLRKYKGKLISPLEDVEAISLDEDMLSRLENTEKENMYFRHFDALDEKCQKILQWFFDRISLKEIAERLDTSEQYIKKRKFMCKEKLISAIQSDPSFRELTQLF